jgi:hypothetical protein
VLALQLGQLANAEVVPASVWLGTLLVVSGLVVYQWGPLRDLLRRRRCSQEDAAEDAAKLTQNA